MNEEKMNPQINNQQVFDEKKLRIATFIAFGAVPVMGILSFIIEKIFVAVGLFSVGMIVAFSLRVILYLFLLGLIIYYIMKLGGYEDRLSEKNFVIASFVTLSIAVLLKISSGALRFVLMAEYSDVSYRLLQFNDILKLTGKTLGVLLFFISVVFYIVGAFLRPKEA